MNSSGLRAIWQRLQLSAHSSAPDRGSTFTWVVWEVVFALFLGLGAGVCAVAGKLIVTTAALMVTTAKRWIDLIGLLRRVLVPLGVRIASC